MINKITYNNSTKQFGIVSALNGPTAAAVSSAVGIVGGLAGLAGTAAQFRNDKYTVICKSANNKITSRTLRAASSMEAIKKAKIKGMNGDKFRAFQTPQQDNEAQDYYEALSRTVNR